ncbi:MAG: exodeoxyribonuclease III [Marinagarivorans sp.]|nr:exodeoxyribonuclease III [Marinagarivorans sp.]
MKCISFNVNSVRMRLHQLQNVIDTHNPDVIGLQETKVTDPDFPIADINGMGYNAIFIGQKTHYGVALLIKNTLEFDSIVKGYDTDDDGAQKRFIGARISLPSGQKVTVLNGYFPQGESQDHPIKYPAKAKYYRDLQSHIQKYHTPGDNLIVMGDMNISHTDLDIGIGEANRKRWLKTLKCSFLPEEREWLNMLLSWGLIDTYRHQNPTSTDRYSWFDYRSKGFEDEPKRGLRIDLILASAPLIKTLKTTGIDYITRGMEKPSDHCPIWAEFTL